MDAMPAAFVTLLCGITFLAAAVIMLLFTIVFHRAQWSDEAGTLTGLGILALAAVYMIARTEIALKRKFPNT